MPPTAYLLYATAVLVWGSTWLAITYQLGEVDPLVSVVYRFSLAAVLLFAWSALRRARLRLSAAEHGWIALQGISMFGLNYWLIYRSELYLTSGIVAVIFALLVFLNIFNGRLFLGRPVTAPMLLGALLGVGGVAALFWPEIGHLGLGDAAIRGALLALGGTAIASIGNILAARNVRYGLPVIAANAWGMSYGALALVLVALVTGTPFAYPAGFAYSAALLYLAVFGSIVAFGAYLRLIALIGPDRAGYSSTAIPVVALLFSTLFEDFGWSVPAALGLVLIVLGNVLVLRGRPA